MSNAYLSKQHQTNLTSSSSTTSTTKPTPPPLPPRSHTRINNNPNINNPNSNNNDFSNFRPQLPQRTINNNKNNLIKQQQDLIEILSVLGEEGNYMMVIGLFEEEIEKSRKKKINQISFDTCCKISDDGKSLQCELTKFKKITNIIFSDIEKIIPYIQPFTSTPNYECVQYFSKYFSEFYLTSQELEEALLPWSLQLFMIKYIRKNVMTTVGFIFPDPMMCSIWIRGLQLLQQTSQLKLNHSNNNNTTSPSLDELEEENNNNSKKHSSFGQKLKNKMKLPNIISGFTTSSKSINSRDQASALGGEDLYYPNNLIMDNNYGTNIDNEDSTITTFATTTTTMSNNIINQQSSLQQPQSTQSRKPTLFSRSNSGSFDLSNTRNRLKSVFTFNNTNSNNSNPNSPSSPATNNNNMASSPPTLNIFNNNNLNGEKTKALSKQLKKLKKVNQQQVVSATTPISPPGSDEMKVSSNYGGGNGPLHSSLDLKRKGSSNNIHQQMSQSNLTSDDQKLFEVVVVVKLKKLEDDKLQPYIHYEFPPQNVRREKDLKIIHSIPLFCFPDIDIVKEEEYIEKKTYSFVLTEIDGKRKHGYCRRMLPKGQGKRLPETYCIISQHSCFNLFSTILDNIEIRNEINPVACFTFLKTVLANPYPEPGSYIIIKSVNPKSGLQEEVELSRPSVADLMLEYINFGVFFQTISIDNLIILFSSLLLERRILVFCSDISKLSSFCQAMISILYPFSWQHIFIPVLPQSLIEYVCSPVPFVIGVLSNHKSYVDELRNDGQMEEEVIYLDLDNNEIQKPKSLSDEELLPEQKELKKKLVNVEKDVKKNFKSVTMTKDTFLFYFVKLFGDYKKFIHFTSINKKEFDTKKFIESKKKEYKKKIKFFEMFIQSQMFERWSHEMANIDMVNSGGDTGEGENMNNLFEQMCAHYK